MLEKLNNSDWECAFECAGGQPGAYNSADIRPALPGSDVSLADFGREDVAEILAIDEGANDEADWLCFGKLVDGRYFLLAAGCDYTGWDCQSGGHALVADSKEELLQYGISDPEKIRLRIGGDENETV